MMQGSEVAASPQLAPSPEEDEYAAAENADADDGRAKEGEETREELLGMVFEACRIDRVDIINESMERLMADGSEKEGGGFVDGGGFSPLHVACAHGNADCVRALLRYSSDNISAKEVNSDGKRAIDCCDDENVLQAFTSNLLQRIATGDENGVLDLLEGGIDVTIDDGGPEKASMLHWAASFGQSARMMQMLIDFGCDPNAVNTKNETPLHEACKGAHEDAARALLKAGASIEARDSSGKTPAEVAKNADFAEALVQWASSPNGEEAPADGAPADDIAAANRRVAELRLIKEENDELIKMLKANISTLLEEKGVVTYIKKLKAEIRTLEDEVRRNVASRPFGEALYILQISRGVCAGKCARSAARQRAG